MSAQDERLRLALKKFHATDFTTIPCTVLEVDSDLLTVDVEPTDGGAKIFGVRLRADIDEQRGGLVLVPAVGSTVLVSAMNDNWNSAYVAMVSELHLITIKTGKESLKQWLKDVLTEVRRTTHTSPAGETKFPTNALAFKILEDRLDDLLLD